MAETVARLVQAATKQLKEKGIEAPKREARYLLRHILGLSEAELLGRWEEIISPQHLKAYLELVERRSRRVPAAYLTGKRAFLSWEFLVDERAMVPRPETELLVLSVEERLLGAKAPFIADVGTGCGNIAISLAKMLPHSRLLAVDSSWDALQLAKENLRLHKCENQIRLVCGDLLTFIRAFSRVFTAIVANLPYIPSSVIGTLEPEVSGFEPRLALNGGDDGLILIKRLIYALPGYLAPGGLAGLEVGEGQAGRVREMLREIGHLSGTEVIRDYAGLERVVLGFAAD